MHRDEALKLLKGGEEGIREWNRRRAGEAIPNLTDADLSAASRSEADLFAAKLSYAILSGADLFGANLRRGDLSGANLSRAELSGANLSRSNLSNANLSNAKLSNAKLSYAILSGADLFGANFRDADLSRTNFNGANLDNATLGDANLKGAHLTKAKLNRAALGDANLTFAELNGAILNGASLPRANLRHAKLTDADLIDANLIDANLTDANLTDANLTAANLIGANLTTANLTTANLGRARCGRTIFANVDLSEVRGLDSIGHSGPSTIGIDTLFRSQGKIPEGFLRGCGVPETLIAYLPFIMGAMQPIQFYSCFISYSSKDQPFAERLYADLQGKGVRCWYAPEDLKIGEKIRVGIDESIRIHDKLLLVLSKNSVASDWVEKEVETAMEKERQQKRVVLFPIRLDDGVMKIETGWPADIRRSRNIGDFKKWKTHDAYQKAFDRLLRDFKPEESTGVKPV